MTEREEDFKKLTEKIEEVSSRLSAVSNNVKELANGLSQERLQSKTKDSKMFWWGTIFGVIGGVLGNLLVSYMMKLYDFISVPLLSWIIAIVILSVFVGIILILMWKMSTKEM